jgi:acyl carrier protein
VLHVSGIDREDNFFFLGGSSLLVTRVIAKIKQEFNIELPVRDVFANPVLQALALHLKTMLGEVSPRVTATAMRRGARLPRIESQFIASGHEQLFSIYYPGRGAVKRHSVLICGTVGHEYARSHRNLQQLAQMLAEQGFNVLRFDYAGTGNSSGSCESGAPKQWCAEISSAAKWLRVHSQCENFSTIGLRLGATLLSNVEGIESEHQILWDPAISGERFLSQLAQYHRRALQDFVRYSKQRSAEPHQFFGFVTNERAMIDLCKMKLKFPNKKSHGRSLLLTTKDYWRNETHDSPQVSLGNYIDHQQVDDEVLWHWPQYTESAFASANSYRWILNELTGSYK